MVSQIYFMSYGKYTKQFELYYWDNSSNRQYINLPIYSLFYWYIHW